MNPILVALLAFLTVEALARPQPASEQVIFSCRAGVHVATVVRNGGTLVYRSMSHGRVELQIADGRIASTGFSGGGEVQASFRNGAWTYVIYQRTTRTEFSGRNDAKGQAGVDALLRGRVVSGRGCDDQDVAFDEGALRGASIGPFVAH